MSSFDIAWDLKCSCGRRSKKKAVDLVMRRGIVYSAERRGIVYSAEKRGMGVRMGHIV